MVKVWSFSFLCLLSWVLFVPCLFYMPAIDYLDLPRDVFWTISVLFLLLWKVFKSGANRILNFDLLDKSLIVFLGWALISSTWAWEPQLSWQKWLLLFSAYVTYKEVRLLNEKQVDFLLRVIVFQGVFFVGVGFFQNHNLSPFALIPQTEEPGIMMGHRNVAAEYLLMTLGASLYMIFRKWHPWKLVVLISCIAHLWLMKEMYCRGVLLGIGLSVLFVGPYILICKVKVSKTLVFSIGAILVILLGGIVFAKAPGLSESFRSDKIESIYMRQQHYSNTVSMINHTFPKGAGLGNFAIGYSLHLNDWIPEKHYSDNLILSNTHSDPLQCLAEMGVVGLIIALTVLWICFFKLPVVHGSEFILAATILAQVFNSCLNFPFQVIQTIMMMAILLGLLSRGKTLGSVVQISFSKTLWFKFLLLVSFLLIAHFQVSRLRASIIAKQGLEAMVAKNYNVAENKLRESIEIQPRNVSHIMLLGYCLLETGYHTESSSLAENVLGIFPGYLAAYNLIGMNALRVNDLNRAMRAYEKSYELQAYQQSTKDKLATTYMLVSAAYRQQGYFKQAYEIEKKLVKVKPELTYESQLRQIRDLITIGSLPLAESIFSKLKGTHEDIRYWFIKARLYLALNKKAHAYEAVEEGLKIKPDDAMLLNIKKSIVGEKKL